MDLVRPNDVRPADERRRTPACAAPFVAMEFDQFGDVQACCANALYPLGNVTRTSLHDIWHGERAVALRAALLRGDMSYGCGVCRHRLDSAYGELPRDYYDNFPFTSVDPDWPYSLQFSLHNTCNLECVMCGADRSSRIRSRRAHLDPLPHAYDDSFFEQLGPFLDHCGAADFSGGEPFLVAEHYRVWDMLAEMDRRPLCSLTTNGTVWNDRVESVLDRLDLHISVSIDGTSRHTLESIRVGADFTVVHRNLDRFARYTAERGTELTITWSLVRQNWYELGDMMRFAEARGIPVKVQTVIEPAYGVQRAPTDELRFIVESLEAEGRTLRDDLSLNLGMWDREVARLRAELAARDAPGPRPVCSEPPSPRNADHVAAVAGIGGDGPRRRRTPRAAVDRAVRELGEWAGGRPVGEVSVAHDGRVVSSSIDDVLAPARFDGSFDGAPFADLVRAFAAAFDGSLWISDQTPSPDGAEQTLWIGRDERDKIGLVLRLVSFVDRDAVRILVAADDRLLRGIGGPVAVSLGARRRPPAVAPASGR